MTRVVDLRRKEKKEVISPTEKVFLVDPVRSLARAKSASPKDLGEASNGVEQKEKEKILRVATNPLPEKINRFEWEAPSFYYNPQKKYLTLIVIALFCGAGAMLFYRMDTLTAIFLIISSFVLILYANKKPTISKVVVNQAGVIIDGHSYHYKELKSFWLDYNPSGLKELSLEAKKWYMPYVKISIENQNPVELRSLMINFITEKEHEKSLVDLISRKIGL